MSSLSSLMFFPVMGQLQKKDAVLSEIKAKYAPDTRVEVFDIELAEDERSITLKGETSSKEAHRALMEAYQKKGRTVKDSVRLLPDESLDGRTWGVIYNSACYVHQENRYGAEIVTQALLGTPVRILDQADGWRRVQTPDKYIGWVNGSVKPMTKEEIGAYLAKPRVVVTSFYAVSHEKPDAVSQSVSDLVAGDMLSLKAARGNYFHVVYPDGREAYIAKTDAAEEKKWLRDIHLSEENVLNTAFRFKGVPYFWGGTSTKGVDCSGFTKMVYFLNGVILARDASQQVGYGIGVDAEGRFEGLRKGDLMFFGTKPGVDNPRERVVHVGIYIGDKRFIHASDYIRVSSFDPADPLFDAYNTKRYLRSKRIIGAVNTAGIDEIRKNEFYR